MQNADESVLSMLDVLRPEYVANPYPLYQQVRSLDPVYWDGRMGGTWVLTRYQDVIGFLRDPRASAARARARTCSYCGRPLSSASPPVGATLRAVSRRYNGGGSPDSPPGARDPGVGEVTVLAALLAARLALEPIFLLSSNDEWGKF